MKEAPHYHYHYILFQTEIKKVISYLVFSRIQNGI